MADLDQIAASSLLADANKPLLVRLLDTALSQSLVPMEPAAAQQYMEQVAEQAARDANTAVQLFQTIELRSDNHAYVMRVALFSDHQAMGLDIMDAENGQFFVPTACPVVVLAAPTLN